MGTEVGSLYVSIGAQMDGVKKGLEETDRLMKQAASSAKASGSEVAAGADKMGTSLEKLGSIAKAIAVSGVIATVVQQLKSTVDATLQWGNSVDTLTDMFGMTGEVASSWAVAMQHVGVSVAEGGMQLNYFTRMLSEANKKMAEGEATPFSRSLDRLGVSAQDSSGKLRSFDDLMPSIMDAFQKLPAGVDATAIAMDLFGARGGSKFLDFLRMGSAGLEDAADKAREFGLEIDSLESDRIEQFGFELNDLGMRFEGLKTNIGIGLIDPLNGVIDLIEQAGVGIGYLQLLGQNIGTAFGELGALLGMPTKEDQGTMGAERLAAAKALAKSKGIPLASEAGAANQLGPYLNEAVPKWVSSISDVTFRSLQALDAAEFRDLARAGEIDQILAAEKAIVTGGGGAGLGAFGGLAAGPSMAFPDILARAFGGNLGGAMSWQSAFASEHGGATPGATDIRDKLAGDLFFQKHGRAATQGEWEERYFKGGFEGVDESGLDALFGPSGTLATKMDEAKKAEDENTKAIIAAFAAELGKTLTVQFANKRLTD